MPTITEDFVKTMNKKFKKTNYRPWDVQPNLSRNDELFERQNEEKTTMVESDVNQHTKKNDSIIDEMSIINTENVYLEHKIDQKSQEILSSDLLPEIASSTQEKNANINNKNEDSTFVTLETHDISSLLGDQKESFLEKKVTTYNSSDVLLIVRSLFGVQKQIMTSLLGHIDVNFSDDDFLQTLPIFIEEFAKKIGVSAGTFRTSLSRLREKDLIVPRFYKRGRGGFTIFLIKTEVAGFVVKFNKETLDNS